MPTDVMAMTPDAKRRMRMRRQFISLRHELASTDYEGGADSGVGVGARVGAGSNNNAHQSAPTSPLEPPADSVIGADERRTMSDESPHHTTRATTSSSTDGGGSPQQASPQEKSRFELIAAMMVRCMHGHALLPLACASRLSRAVDFSPSMRIRTHYRLSLQRKRTLTCYPPSYVSQ